MSLQIFIKIKYKPKTAQYLPNTMHVFLFNLKRFKR